MDPESDIRQISKGLYYLLNDIIGHDTVIKVRRTISDLRDKFEVFVSDTVNQPCVLCYSGSKAEGFRFESSDDDWMTIFRDIKVISDMSYAHMYDSNSTVLLMDNQLCKPGFTLLRLISRSQNPFILFAAVQEAALGGQLISSKKWREIHVEDSIPLGTYVHGPCASGKNAHGEYDVAGSFRSEIWPEMAESCVRRLHQCGWPPHAVIRSIVEDGILFVAVAAKQSEFENLEWRISFSMAEKKLIHAMNHTQFLCYGLLKMFLKEAIDAESNVKGIMCSYFLKTSVLWEITDSLIPWTPETLLQHFWNCFQRLLHWVNSAYCPNFFIPENNMFADKVEGENRAKLLTHLCTLYSEGYRSLLRYPTLCFSLEVIILFPAVVTPLMPSILKCSNSLIA